MDEFSRVKVLRVNEQGWLGDMDQQKLAYAFVIPCPLGESK